MTRSPTYASTLGTPPTPAMRSKIVAGLSWFIAALALVVAGAGLLADSQAGPVSFTTVHGQVSELYGGGLYRNDTASSLPGSAEQMPSPSCSGSPCSSRRACAIGAARCVARCCLPARSAIPLRLCQHGVGHRRLQRAVPRLCGALLGQPVRLRAGPHGIDRTAMAAPFSAAMPRRGPAAFLFASALVTFVVWSTPVVDALVRRTVPARLDMYSTPVTTALDLAVITPAAVLAGALILRFVALGTCWRYRCWSSR